MTKKAEKAEEAGAKYMQSSTKMWVDGNSTTNLVLKIGDDTVDTSTITLEKLKAKLIKEAAGKSVRAIVDVNGHSNAIILYDDTILRHSFLGQTLLKRRGYLDGVKSVFSSEEDFKHAVYLAGCVGEYTELSDQGDVPKIGMITDDARKKHIENVIKYLETLPLAEALELQKYLFTLGYAYKGLAYKKYLEDKATQLGSRKRMGAVYRKGNLNFIARLNKAAKSGTPKEFSHIKNAGKRNWKKNSCNLTTKRNRNAAPKVVHPAPLLRDTKKEHHVLKLVCIADEKTGKVYRLQLNDAMRLSALGENFKFVPKSAWKIARANGLSSYSYAFKTVIPEVKRKVTKRIIHTAKEQLLHAENKEARVIQRNASNRFKNASKRRAA